MIVEADPQDMQIRSRLYRGEPVGQRVRLEIGIEILDLAAERF
jgi:hypothetical protein